MRLPFFYKQVFLLSMHTFVKATLRLIIGACHSFISKLFQKKRLSEQYSSKILSWQRYFIGGNGFNSSVRLGGQKEGVREEEKLYLEG